MKNLKRDFIKKREYFQKRDSEIRTEIEKLEKELHQLENPYWFDDLVKPLMKKIVDKVDKFNYSRCLGPSGLRNSVVLVFAEEKKHIDYILDYPDENYSICIFPTDLDKAEFKYYTSEKAVNKYDKGNIAEINGMNNDTKILPEDIDEIIELILDPKI
jgi:hypothetical protein